MSVDTGLEMLSGTFLGQDWELFGATADECIRRFVRGQSDDDVRASITGLEALLATSMTEDEFEDHWVMKLDGGYDPGTDGRTFREFFAHALDLLRAGATGSR